MIKKFNFPTAFNYIVGFLPLIKEQKMIGDKQRTQTKKQIFPNQNQKNQCISKDQFKQSAEQFYPRKDNRNKTSLNCNKQYVFGQKTLIQVQTKNRSKKQIKNKKNKLTQHELNKKANQKSLKSQNIINSKQNLKPNQAKNKNSKKPLTTTIKKLLDEDLTDRPIPSRVQTVEQIASKKTIIPTKKSQGHILSQTALIPLRQLLRQTEMSQTDNNYLNRNKQLKKGNFNIKKPAKKIKFEDQEPTVQQVTKKQLNNNKFQAKKNSVKRIKSLKNHLERSQSLLISEEEILSQCSIRHIINNQIKNIRKKINLNKKQPDQDDQQVQSLNLILDQYGKYYYGLNKYFTHRKNKKVKTQIIFRKSFEELQQKRSQQLPIKQSKSRFRRTDKVDFSRLKQSYTDKLEQIQQVKTRHEFSKPINKDNDDIFMSRKNLPTQSKLGYIPSSKRLQQTNKQKINAFTQLNNFRNFMGNPIQDQINTTTNKNGFVSQTPDNTTLLHTVVENHAFQEVFVHERQKKFILEDHMLGFGFRIIKKSNQLGQTTIL